MSGRNRFHKSATKLNVLKQDEVRKIPGELGLKLGGTSLVEVPNRPGFVYVRLRSDQNEVVQAYNDKVSPVYGLPVTVVRDRIDKGRYYIDGRDTGRYNNWGSSSYLPLHGSTHSFTPSQPGADITWVWDRQFTPLLTVPSGTAGGLGVTIYPGTLYYNDNWKAIGFTGTSSLAAYKPTDATARMVLVSIDTAGNPVLTPGGTFSPLLSGTSEVYPYIPSIPSSSVMAISAIRLVSGTSVLTWDNIYDLRQFTTPMTTGTRGHKILDDTFVMPTRSNLAFAGNQFLLYDDAGNDRTVVSGTYPVGASGHTIQYNLSTMTDRSRLRFSGPSFLVYDDVGSDVTIVSGSPAFNNSVFFSGSLTFQDNAVSVTQRDTIDFVGTGFEVYDDPINLKTIVSGTVEPVSYPYTFKKWIPDIPPTTGTHWINDEFNDSSLDAKWTEFDMANYVGVSENQNGLEFWITNLSTGTAPAGLYISLSGTVAPYSVVLKLNGIWAEHQNWASAYVGIALSSGPHTGATSVSKGIVINNSPTSFNIYFMTYSGMNQLIPTINTITSNPKFGQDVLLRIRSKTTGSFWFDISYDGLSWINGVANNALGFVPTHLSIFARMKQLTGSPTGQARAAIDFIRFFQEESFTGTVGGWVNIPYS